MDLPTELVLKLAGRSLEAISLGDSGATVWRCTSEHAPALFLKAAPIAAKLKLEDEAHRLRWMKAHDLPVPGVREHGRIAGIEYLLVEEVPGTPASAQEWTLLRPQVVRALGEGLASLHQTDTSECPFDCRLATQIANARRRIAAGQVREDDFDEIRAGRSTTALFAELVSSVPDSEELVFVHGDYCLPNIILQQAADGEVQVAGLIDCGRAGIADRHQDLALALRSITCNIGSEWVQPFFEAYGLTHPNPEKLRFFTLLDEFF